MVETVMDKWLHLKSALPERVAIDAPLLLATSGVARLDVQLELGGGVGSERGDLSRLEMFCLLPLMKAIRKKLEKLRSL